MVRGAATLSFMGSKGAETSVTPGGKIQYSGSVQCLALYQTGLKIFTLIQP